MLIPSSKRFEPYKKRKFGRARLSPGRDIAIGIAFADTVQTELDPPAKRLKPFANRYDIKKGRNQKTSPFRKN